MSEQVAAHPEVMEHELSIRITDTTLRGNLVVPRTARSIVLFTHEGGDDRTRTPTRFVAAYLRDQGIATLLLDLMTPEEEADDARTGHLRYNVALLGRRLSECTVWAQRHEETRRLEVGYCGMGTGAAAALTASAWGGRNVKALVSLAGRADLAEEVIAAVKTPVLFIVPGTDQTLVDIGKEARQKMRTQTQFAIVPRASPSWEEPGGVEEAARLVGEWFERFLPAPHGWSPSPTPPHIDHYSFGRMLVNGVEYTRDLIVFPDGVRARWWRREGHVLVPEDLGEVIAYRPRLLIVGTGASGCMRIPNATRRKLAGKGIELQARATGSAVRLFGEESAHGNRVVGAFHLTC
jgi:dienelactone hydrolase